MQLLDSHQFRCGEEILSIAAMTSVSSPFIIPDEGRSSAGAAGELERRKFTAEEGDHLTLLNVYNAFVNPRVGRKSSKWAASHRLNFKALSRAVSIRAQLEKYLRRWEIPIESCEGDQRRLRRCLVSGYFKNAAKMQPDGSYRSVRENAVSDTKAAWLSAAFFDTSCKPFRHRLFMFTPLQCCSTVYRRQNG